jgi:hypothetical protein
VAAIKALVPISTGGEIIFTTKVCEGAVTILASFDSMNIDWTEEMLAGITELQRVPILLAIVKDTPVEAYQIKTLQIISRLCERRKLVPEVNLLLLLLQVIFIFFV